MKGLKLCFSSARFCSCDGRSNCINWYTFDSSSAGCALNFLKFSSALCCSIHVVQAKEKKVKSTAKYIPRLPAFQLSSA